MRKFTTLTAFTVVVGLVALASPVLAQTTVTSFAPSTNTTPGVWFENDVRFGGTASIADLTGLTGDLETAQPLPIGAAKLTTSLTNFPDKAEVGVLNSYGTPDGIFSTLSIMYSYHKASNTGQNLAAAPSLKLTFFNAVCDDPASIRGPGGPIDCFATLVYEPTWNGPGSTSTSPGSSNPATDVWTAVTIDKDTGLFWTTGGFGFANTAGGPPIKTLAEWRTALSSDFGDATLFRVSVGVGSFNHGQIGYFDDVRIAGTNADASYDFDPPPPPPTPVDIDIKPGSDPNSINLCSMGVIPVAIFGSTTFDVNDINISSLALADADVKVAGKSGKDLCRVTDANGDAFDDLVCQFLTVGLALTGGDTTAKVVGLLNDNTPFEGTDSVNIVKDDCG